MNMVRLLFVGIVLVAAFGFIVFQMLQFFFSIQVSTQKLKTDIDRMKIKLVDVKKTLLEMNGEVMGLLSFDREENFISNNVTSLKEGFFTSIFHEPILAYAYRKYKGRNDKAVLLVETKQDTYEYYISSKSTRVLKNGEAYGIILSDGKLLDNENELLASIEINDNNLLSINLKENPVAMLHNPSKPTSSLSRAFEMLDSDDPAEQERILILSTLLAVQADA